jgi:phosphoglycerol transferase MdoB-like AlkP superfamily enzyme
MKKNIFKNELNNIIKEEPIVVLYILGNFLNAIMLRLFTTGHLMVRGVLFDLGFLIFLGFLSFIIDKKKRKIYYAITSFIMVATCVANSLYYNYYGSYVSVSLLATSVFVKDFGDVVMDMVVRLCDFSYLWLFIAIGVSYKKNKITTARNKLRFKEGLVISLICLAIGSAMPPYNAFSRLYKLWNRAAVVDYFGPYIYQIDDIVQSLKPTFNNMFGYDKALKDTKDYYDSKNKTIIVNEYSNIFQGKNVIVIHAESLQTFTLGLKFNGEEVAPNINKLASSGIYFSNFYAQVGVGTSSDSEFTYATSLLPSNNGTVFVNYYNDKFVTIQQLLKNNGYYVFSMHGNDGDFWNREIMHANMGYDKFYSKSSFEIDKVYGLGLADESFFKQAVPMIKEINAQGKPYYGTLITLTNHTPWRDAKMYSNYQVGEYLDDTLMGRYIKSVNYMDKAIGSFIDDLDKEGLLDNTVIVIYGDHDARMGKREFEHLYNYDINSGTVRSVDDPKYVDFNNYDYELSKKVPFIIWTKDMEKGNTIDKPMGMIDVLPTLGNMLGVSSKYALGNDIMNIKREDAMVVFKDGSFITDKIYYSVKNRESYTISSGIITDDYISKRSDYADKIIEVSNNIIVYDLIDKMEFSK